jgi:hypothetical protein
MQWLCSIWVAGGDWPEVARGFGMPANGHLYLLPDEQIESAAEDLLDVEPRRDRARVGTRGIGRSSSCHFRKGWKLKQGLSRQSGGPSEFTTATAPANRSTRSDRAIQQGRQQHEQREQRQQPEY